MIEILKSWYQRHFSNPQVVILALLLLLGFAVVVTLGDILAPLLGAVMFAYLLESVVGWLERLGLPRLAAVLIVLLVAVALTVVALFGLAPLLYQQIKQLIRELPSMLGSGQSYLLQLPQAYPEIFSEQQVQELITSLRSDMGNVGQRILTFLLSIAPNFITFGIYMILVPILIFFMLKDKQQIVDWFGHFMPKDADLSRQVWSDVDVKIGNYVRGKFIEIGIIWAASYSTFAIMGLNYALLLSFLVGISVIIPYIGAIAVTIPVALIAFFQWGGSAQFVYLLIAYQVIQILDGNVLVPVLFSEVVNLHPVAIIAAVVFFGGIWGAWGVFFAIPLATLVQAVLKAWPRFDELQDEPQAAQHQK